MLTGLGIGVVQTIYLTLSLVYRGARHISLFSWILYSLALFITVAVNEFIKRQEIKVNVRFQKRARLEFGTKLGINSPF